MALILLKLNCAHIYGRINAIYGNKQNVQLTLLENFGLDNEDYNELFDENGADNTENSMDNTENGADDTENGADNTEKDEINLDSDSEK
ncbi:1546_t:CDS:2, partial [Gigaspora rosea]